MSPQDISNLVDLNLEILSATGQYYDFQTIHDAQTFLNGFEYYMSEGFGKQLSEEFTRHDMDI